jgi:hypothetical protein
MTQTCSPKPTTHHFRHSKSATDQHTASKTDAPQSPPPTTIDAHREPPPKRQRIDFIEQLKVLVGPDKTAFYMPKNVIVARSPFFMAAADKKWESSGATKDIELKDEDPKIFANSLQCVYHQDPELDVDSSSLFLIAFKTYIMTDTFGDLRSANIIADYIIKLVKDRQHLPCGSVLFLAFEQTHLQSPLRRLIVDMWLHEGGTNSMVKWSNACPAAFFKAFMNECFNLTKSKGKEKVDIAFDTGPSKREKCHYHQHDDSCPPCI